MIQYLEQRFQILILIWHYTDEIRELNFNIIGSLDVDVTNIGDEETRNVLDVTSGSGTTGLSIDCERIRDNRFESNSKF